jgi:hypothetical protein
VSGFHILISRLIECTTSRTDVIIPQGCMDIIDHAIQRDGIAFARVPPSVELEISRYGPQDPLEMFAFRIFCYPDTSDIPICDECVSAIEKRLESRVQLADRQSMATSFPRNSVIVAYWEVNTFRDILMTLLRQLWRGIMVANVFHS